jgi:NAD-dependent SIR2 family protein deacetylase
MSQMYAINPKLDCPHFTDADILEKSESLTEEKIHAPCTGCFSRQENWMCLECDEVFCSRYVEGHMSDHNEQTRHPVAFSFTDASVWCYECDAYIYSNSIRIFCTKFQNLKFKDTTLSEGEPILDGPPTSFPYSDLIEGMKNKKFHRISVLTGAGISVAAGIPDFRTPEIGLYSRVAKLGLPYPEAVFNISFFQSNPYPFYTVAKEFLNYKAHPVDAHYFIKKLNDENQLLLNYTQNIDGLELDAGLPSEKLIQAHGHMRSAHCLDCKKEYSEISEFFTCLEEDRIWFCSDCNPTGHDAIKGDSSGEIPNVYEDGKIYRGLIKPDVVFFGEALPSSFKQQFPLIQQSDLVIVMGTALKVFPFAFLLEFLNSETPVLLINRENPGVERNNLLFIPGDIQESIRMLATDLNWTLETPVTSEDHTMKEIALENENK